MELTISLDEIQTEYVRRQAVSRHLSPEQFARELLRSAWAKWLKKKSGRPAIATLVLIAPKSRVTGLTQAETTGVKLQSALDQREEPP